MRCRDLEVAPLNVRRAQPVVASRQERPRSNSLHALVWSYTTHPRIFEGGQKPRENGAWPRDIVVCHDNNGRFDLGNCLADLNSLVCNRRLENSNVRSLESLSELDKLVVFVGSRDQAQFVRVAREDALYRISQIREIVMDRRDDYRHIFGCIIRIGRNLDRFVAPMAPKVNYGAEIPVDPNERLSA